MKYVKIVIFFTLFFLYPIVETCQPLHIGPNWFRELGSDIGFPAFCAVGFKLAIDIFKLKRWSKVKIASLTIMAGIVALSVEGIQFLFGIGRIDDTIVEIAGTILAYYSAKD